MSITTPVRRIITLTLTIALTVTSACSIQLSTTEPDTTAPDTTTDSPENQPTGTTALTDTELAEIHKFAAHLEADLYNEATVFTFTEHLTLIAVVVDNPDNYETTVTTLCNRVLTHQGAPFDLIVTSTPGPPGTVDNFGTASWAGNSSELKRCPPF